MKNSLKDIINDLNNGRKIIVADYDIEKENELLNDISDKFKKAKIYDNLKRIYSFKTSLTIIKLHKSNCKFNKIDIKIFSILFKSASRQKVDSIYMPKKFKVVFDDPRFNEYKKLIKYIEE